MENGNASPAPEGPPRISFGPLETDTMPIVWAQEMLTELKNVNPKLFGKLLQRAILGADLRPATRR